MTLTEIVPAVRKLPILERIKLIRILAEDLEIAGDLFPLQEGKTYALPTPYNMFGAATILAEAMAEYQVTSSWRLMSVSIAPDLSLTSSHGRRSDGTNHAIR